MVNSLDFVYGKWYKEINREKIMSDQRIKKHLFQQSNFGDIDCIRCGASIAALNKCHSCGYNQDNIYNDSVTAFFLNKNDYQLSLIFFPNLMINDFRYFQEYAKDIRNKLLSYNGRRILQKLTEERQDGWFFDASV